MYNFQIVWEGKWPSINNLRNNDWRGNQGLKNSWRNKLGWLIKEQRPKRLTHYKIEVQYRSRLDPDNVVLKFFCDALKDCGVIHDDNRSFCKGVSIEPNEELKYNTYVIKVIEV